MAGLVIPTNVTVPVAPDGAERDFVEIGDRARTFDGSMRQTVRAWKNDWTFTTAPMTTADANSVIASLQGTQPMACYGSLINVSSSTTANFHGQLVSEKLTLATTAKRVVLEFKLMES